jgi:predicted RNA-binding protein with PIN domain
VHVPYLIDGNNLMGSWGRPPRGEDGRPEVVRRVSDFCRRRGARAVLVFDGAPLRADRDAQQLGPVSVQVAPPGGDADTVIRGLVDAAPNAKDLVVVTSDKALYSYARTRGARVLRAHEWNALDEGARPAPAARAPRTAGTPGEKPEREDDIEGWLERFSRR